MVVKYEGFLKETLSKLYGMDEQRINWLIEQIMHVLFDYYFLDYYFDIPRSALRKILPASNNARRFSGRRPRRRTLEERRSRRRAALRISDDEWKEIRKGAESK